jgi:LCP family protein required for cell wall assembly
MSRPLDLFVPSRTLCATAERPWRAPDGRLRASGRAGGPPPRPRRRRPSAWRLLRAVALIGTGCLGAALFAFPQIRAAAAAAWPGATAADAFGAQHVRILVLGADRDYGVHGERVAAGGRSDTLMLADIDLQANTAHLMSIPRDTEAEVPGHGIRKINSAYALGGPDLSRRAVENLVGSPVDHIVAVDLDAFRDAVDAVGGVDVTVEKPLQYTDKWAHLEIDLPAGPCHLDGEHAMQFVRFRHDAMADIGRVRRQQDFMRAFRTALKRPTAIAAWPGVVRAIASHTKTDLSPAQMVALGRFAKGLPEGALTTQTLPGTFHRSGWRPDRNALRRLALRP